MFYFHIAALTLSVPGSYAKVIRVGYNECTLVANGDKEGDNLLLEAWKNSIRFCFLREELDAHDERIDELLRF
jgi:hypothetical protein